MAGAAASQVPATAEQGVELARVFGSGQLDGLILYALLLPTIVLLVVIVLLVWLHGRERRDLAASCERQAKQFADSMATMQRENREGLLETSEALRDVATALASQASADMTFKQALGGLIERNDIALTRNESALQRIEILLAGGAG